MAQAALRWILRMYCVVTTSQRVYAAPTRRGGLRRQRASQPDDAYVNVMSPLNHRDDYACFYAVLSDRRSHAQKPNLSAGSQIVYKNSRHPRLNTGNLVLWYSFELRDFTYFRAPGGRN